MSWRRRPARQGAHHNETTLRCGIPAMMQAVPGTLMPSACALRADDPKSRLQSDSGCACIAVRHAHPPSAAATCVRQGDRNVPQTMLEILHSRRRHRVNRKSACRRGQLALQRRQLCGAKSDHRGRLGRGRARRRQEFLRHQSHQCRQFLLDRGGPHRLHFVVAHQQQCVRHSGRCQPDICGW